MVGRKQVIDKVMANLRRKQNTLIIGAGGIGKSTLLMHIATELGASRAHYIEAIIPAKSALLEAYQTIADLSDEQLKEMKVSRWTLNVLVRELLATLSGQIFVLILDGLDRITVAASEWLKVLAESDITLLGACRVVKEGKLLDRFFWTFDTVTLTPMPDREIKEIIRRQVYPSDSSEPTIRFRTESVQRDFVERVIKGSKGIPLTAVQWCRRAMGAGEVTMTFIRDHLMCDHEASMKWVDATPILLIVICIIMAMRYIARGMHDTDAYVFFGALSMIMIVVRMFAMRGSRRRG